MNDESAAHKAPRPATRRTLYFLIGVQVILMVALFAAVLNFTVSTDDARQSTLAVQAGCERDNQIRRAIVKSLDGYPGAEKFAEKLKNLMRTSPAISDEQHWLINCAIAYPLP